MYVKKRSIGYGLLLSSLFLTFGCSEADLQNRNDEESEMFTIDDPIEPITTFGSIKVLSANEAQNFFMTAPTTSNTPPSSIDVADLDHASFVVGQTPDSEGFLSKVIGTRMVDGREVADLAPATIDEVIDQGDWKVEIPAATAAEIEAEPFASDLALVPDYNLEPHSLGLTSTTSPVFKLDLGGKSITAPSTQAGTFSVRIEEGTLTYAPAITIGGKHKGGKIQEFAFQSKGTLTVRMKISANLTKGNSKGVNPVKFPAIKKPFAFMIGAIPVAGTINFDVGGGLRMNSGVSGEVQTDVTCSFPITVGGKFKDGKWQKASSPSLSCKAGNFTSSAQANAGVKVSLTPELSVRLYGVIGPAIDLEPYVGANTTFKPSPKSCTYDVKAGLSSSFSVNATLFKWSATAYSATLFDRSKLLKTGTFCN